MTWSASYSSVKDLNDAEIPPGADEDQFEAAKAAALSILKSKAVSEGKPNKNHLEHADNKNKTAQALVRISLFGHSGGGSPASVGCTVSEA